ncbi:MAG: Ferrochelatase [Chlamydiae bacterium]|nr:Ferrochelatase [Chlamydiota bacterium]
MKTDLTKVKKKKALVLANFGGPRDIKEVGPFLKALLCDKEVVRTSMPDFLHNYIFSRIAKRRAKTVSKDYQGIGGKSPIYEDTEKVANQLRERVDMPILTFHRYLPATHTAFIKELSKLDVDEVLVFPMFPQFSYSTSGSIAKWFDQKLSKRISTHMLWLKSYPAHKPYVDLYCNRIDQFIQHNNLKSDSLLLLFSAHGLPKKFVKTGDPYQRECEQSFQAISSYFPQSVSLLCYQSKFGPGEWLKPYTVDVCLNIQEHAKGRTNVLFIPLAFTSDHIETLYEVETEYMPMIRNKGLKTFRLPAFNHGLDWIDTIEKLLKDPSLLNNQMLIRHH